MSASSLVYLDTNVFILGFEFGGVEAQPVHQLLTALKEVPKAIVTSELTLAELLAPPKRENDFPFARKAELYGNLLIWSGLIDLWPVSRQVLIGTAVLRQNWLCKLPDAIHMVSALHAGCAFFMSNDRDMNQSPHGIKRILPDQPGVATILDALRA
ncbi:PIN domain-containing protein [Methylocapsa polymorpha]|uniref:PIN domain-containing protein n=1 Tax=Methylocapsa polymorpha TaxID=3080828 RepID=A0ABZ0HMT4_9HYPH|nr:PIN domain-containing protein [Methylocapsa sp. RX1]